MMELMVEGGLSRMVGLFHRSDFGYVGPVRSVRPTDALLESLGATVGISGAQPWIADLVGGRGRSDHPGRAGRPADDVPDQWEVAPYNLYTNTLQLRLEADARRYPDSPARAVQLWTVPVRRSAAGDHDRSLVVRSGLDGVDLGWCPLPAVDEYDPGLLA